MTKTVNLYSPTVYTVKGVQIKGFVNKAELSLEEIRVLLGAGVDVSEDVDGKIVKLNFTNYTQDFRTHKVVKPAAIKPQQPQAVAPKQEVVATEEEKNKDKK